MAKQHFLLLNTYDLIKRSCYAYGKSIDSKLYSSQLDRMYEKLKEKYPSLTNRKRALLQQDNTKPHTANRTAEKL